MQLKDLLKRKFTKELEGTNRSVYDLFDWKSVNVKLMDYKTGRTIYEGNNLEFPESYSQQACDIIASKYFKRANVPNDRGYEYSMKQVVHRMVQFWMESLVDEKMITKEQGQIFYDEVAYLILSQRLAPNSPQWFNTGLKYYNTNEDSDGHYYYDEKLKKVVQSKDKYSRTQGSACFIISLEDKLIGNKSISEHYITETRLFKHGSGTGTNYSTLRAKGEKLSGGGTSSGVMSFLEGFDRNAGTIKSGGTSRRAAKMVQLDIDHPEILDFISWKAKEEQKVRDLGKMGYDISFNGDAYSTVSGQNGNNTVGLLNDFMILVKDYLENGVDHDFELKGRIDNSINRTEKVSVLWNELIRCAYECADPAPQFRDIFNEWHTCPAGEDGKYGEYHNRINSTNPCGEYAFLDDTSCNLASINILRFYDMETGIFDVESYKHTIFLSQLLLEATIHWGQFPTEDVARRTYLFRTTGLGIANASGLGMAMCLPYNSNEFRQIIASITSIMTGYSYFTSALMAQQVGAFEKYNINKPYMLKVIRNHSRVANAMSSDFEGLTIKPLTIDETLLKLKGYTELNNESKLSWKCALQYGEKYGYRNAQTTVIAPTGTISFAMDCEATSIEPFFSHVAYKKLDGGGYMEIVNPLVPVALKKLGYPEQQIKDIMNYILRKETVTENGYTYEKIADGKLEDCPHLKEEHLPIFDTANKCGTGQRYIQPEGHMLMMAQLMPLISGAISKTVNLPKTATKEDISNIFFKSWELGIKGITVYRDGCKASQPLNSSKDTNTEIKYEDMNYNDLIKEVHTLKSLVNKPKRDRIDGLRYGKTHPAKIEDVKIYTTVNRRENGDICEVYITTDREGSTITGLLNSLSKSISVMLQHHVAPVDIANMLKGQQYEPCGFVERHPYIKYCDSISDLISRILELEIGDYSRCQVKPIKTFGEEFKDFEKEQQKTFIENNIKNNHNEKTDGKRVYGKTCPTCGSSKMKQNGTCYVCIDCGSTTGCS